MTSKYTKNKVKSQKEIEIEKRLNEKLAKKLEFLIELLKVESISGEEYLVRGIILTKLKELGFETTVDYMGNISAIRGQADKYPLLNAHMDIVDNSYSYWGKYTKSSYSSGKSYSSSWSKTKDTSDISNLSYLNGYINPEDEVTKEYMNNYSSADGYDDDEDDDEDEQYKELEKKTYNYHSGLSDKAIERYIEMPYSELNKWFVCSDCVNFNDCSIAGKGICKQFDLDEDNPEAVEVMESIAYDDIIDYGYETATDIDSYEVYIENGKIQGRGKDRVLGGDDKCGIFIALEVARILPNMPMKILFTVEEEIGCVGIDKFVIHSADWFDNVAYSLTIDRREGDNLLWSQLGKRSCDNAFAGRLAKAGIECGIPVKLQDGSVADVITIRDYVPNAVNMSAGYYSAHTSEEYIVISELLQIINWVTVFMCDEPLT